MSTMYFIQFIVFHNQLIRQKKLYKDDINEVRPTEKLIAYEKI